MLAFCSHTKHELHLRQVGSTCNSRQYKTQCSATDQQGVVSDRARPMTRHINPFTVHNLTTHHSRFLKKKKDYSKYMVEKPHTSEMSKGKSQWITHHKTNFCHALQAVWQICNTQAFPAGISQQRCSIHSHFKWKEKECACVFFFSFFSFCHWHTAKPI